MKSKKRILRDARLYLILDRQVSSCEELIKIAKESVKGGVDVVQLRDKEGSPREIVELSKRIKKILRGRALYIINDRVDVAMAVEADGVHLGQDDLSVSFARQTLGQKILIGASCQTWAHVKEAEKQGCDYIGFGSVYKTKTKPERRPMDLGLLRTVSKRAAVPIFAIGGIKREYLSALKNVGVQRVAVCRNICLADNVEHTVREFRDALGH